MVRGDSVKLIFEDDDGAGERMWVTVTDRTNMDEWEGTLDNDPVGNYSSSPLKYKARVRFHPYSVIDIWPLEDSEKVPALSERVPLGNTENQTSIPWYKQPQYLVPIVVGLIGAISTIVAAYL